MGALFTTFVYQPLYNLLIFLYSLLGSDFGLAIIATTLLLKFALLPLSKKQIEQQKRLTELQPRIKELQDKYKDDKETQARELMKFYKENKANPFSGCLPLVIQLVFLIAIYRILFHISQAGLTVNGADLYSFVNNPGAINHFFLNMIDLSKPNAIFAGLAAIAQFFQTKMMMQTKNTPKTAANDQPDFAAMMNKQMLFLGPALTLFIGLKFAAGLSLYWLVSTLFMLAQQWYIQEKRVVTTVAKNA